MSDRTMLLLILPPEHPSEQNEEDYFGFCKTEEEWIQRWEEVTRLEEVLTSLGFHQPDHGNVCVGKVEGCNWDSFLRAEVWTISEQNLAILEGKAREKEELRKIALAKLTTEEKVALGLMDQT